MVPVTKKRWREKREPNAQQFGNCGQPPQSGLLSGDLAPPVMMYEGYFLNIVREHQSERCVSVSSFLLILLKAKEIEYLLPYLCHNFGIF